VSIGKPILASGDCPARLRAKPDCTNGTRHVHRNAGSRSVIITTLLLPAKERTQGTFVTRNA
jgi:hypothetical protein